MSTREYGHVETVWFGREDHGVQTFSLTLQFSGSSQGFGHIALDDKLEASIKADLCALFGVADVAEIKGRQCWALRCFETYNTPIEGLEVDGRRFTLTSWRRKHFPDARSPLETEVARLRRDVEWAQRRARESQAAEATIVLRYTDWEKQ